MHGSVAVSGWVARLSIAEAAPPEQNSSSRSVTQLWSALRCHNTHETQLSTGFQRSQTRAFSDLISVAIKTILNHWKLSVTSDKKVCFSQLQNLIIFVKVRKNLLLILLVFRGAKNHKRDGFRWFVNNWIFLTCEFSKLSNFGKIFCLIF